MSSCLHTHSIALKCTIFNLHSTWKISALLFMNVSCMESQDISVSIVTSLGAGGSGLNSGRTENFIFSTVSRSALGPTWPPVKLGALSLGLIEMGHKADHSPLFSTEVKNAWSYTSTPLMPSWCIA
jgi:hypothetical protein